MSTGSAARQIQRLERAGQYAAALNVAEQMHQQLCREVNYLARTKGAAEQRRRDLEQWEATKNRLYRLTRGCR